MTTEDRKAVLDAIASEVRVCDRCRLSEGRINAVPGTGSPDTEVVFVGEGPGQREDQKGVPFVGAAGGLLEDLLALVGWKREEVFITNVVKCRPPGNRDPEPDEIAACEPFLHRQLEVLDPALLVTLGRFSLQMFMPGDRIGRVHGTERPVDPATGARAATGYAMYHPAAALRQASLKETMQRDMAAIPEALIRARQGRASSASSEPAPVQLTQSTTDSAAVVAATVPAAVAPVAAVESTPAAGDTTPDGLHETTEDATTAVPDDQLGLF
ncbi:MAG: uracil-DNA glycosylase family protein [Chloroflexota bacterium]